MNFRNRIHRSCALVVFMMAIFPALLSRIGEWTGKIDSEFLVYGQTSAFVSVTKVIPQIAVGSLDGNISKYKTVIQIVNEGDTAATISGNFYNTDGTASTLTFTSNLSGLPTLTGSFSSVVLAAKGILVLTGDSASSFTVNWGKIVSSGGTVSISAYFDLTTGDGTQLYSRVGVPSSNADLSRFTIPRVRNVDSGLDIGFALVNTGTASATINATLRGATGSVLSSKSLTLNAGTHTATFAKEFFGLSGELGGTNYSFISFESASAQFAATALAIEGGSLSSFPISTPAAGGGTGLPVELTDGSVTTLKLADGAVTEAKVAAGQVVKSVNSIKDNVTLAAGDNITITPSRNTLTISAAAGGTLGRGSVNTDQLADAAVTATKLATGAAVKSINSLKDDVTLTAGANITITAGRAGALTIAASGGTAANPNLITDDARTAVGVGALSRNTTGTRSTATGYQALNANTTGNENSAFGYSALYSNTTGTANVANGYLALYNNTIGIGGTATGWGALTYNTTGNHNTANGTAALQFNTTGNDNTATGWYALRLNTTGVDNTADGYEALYNNTTGVNNTATGYQSLHENTTGNYNTAAGLQALKTNTTGAQSTAIGANALNNSTTGSSNTAVGAGALQANTTGSSNTGVGVVALSTNTTGTYNTGIGLFADVSTGNLTNATAVGSGAVVNASNKIRLGNSSVTVIEGAVAYTFTSDKNKKENFRPVDGKDVLDKIQNLDVTSWNYIGNDPQQFRHYGPMAQDFFAAFGQDDVGTIGTPTTLSSGDVEGILLIGLKALRHENELLKAAVEELKAEMKALHGN